jgi:chromosome segregation ATPase
MTDQNVTPMVSAPMPSVSTLKWVGLIVLALSMGGNAYLWHVWQRDQAVAEVMAQSRQDLQALQAQVQELQRLKTTVDQWSGDLELLRKAGESGRIEFEALKAEIKRLQDSRVAYEAYVQKQLQTYQAQLTQKMESQKRNEVNW